MILLDPPVQVCAATMLYCGAQCFPNGPRIRIVAVTRHLPRAFLDNSESATEETLGRSHVPVRTEHRVHQVAISITGTIQVAPFAVNLHVRFIDIPALTHFPL